MTRRLMTRQRGSGVGYNRDIPLRLRDIQGWKGKDPALRTVAWTSVLAVLIVFVGQVSSLAGFIAAAVLSIIFIWRLDVVLLVPLVLLQTASTGYWNTGVMGAGEMMAEAGSITIAGVPISLSMVLCGGVACRVFVHWMASGFSNLSRSDRFLVLLWCIAIAVSLSGAVLGRREGNPSWTLPLRSVVWMGAFFYGRILARTSPISAPVLITSFSVLVAGMLTFAVAGVLHGHILFFMVAAAPPLAFRCWVKGNFRWRLLAGYIILVSAIFTLGLGAHDEAIAGGVFATGGSTFTLNGLYLFSLILGYFGLFRSGSIVTRLVATLAGKPAFIMLILLTVTVAVVGPSRRTGIGATTMETGIGEFEIIERFKIKMFDDRSVVWNGALQVILSPPYLIVPSGRTYTLQHPLGGAIEWSYGAHNTILEQLRINGWIAGLSVLAFLFVAVGSATGVIRRGHSKDHVALAIPVVATGLVGVFTGNYPTLDVVAFWFLSFAGYASVRALAHNRHA